MDYTRYVVPYGDALGDGVVQVSFTLPLAKGPTATEAAKRIAMSMHLDDIQIPHNESIDDNYTFFVVYGKLKHPVDMTTLPDVEDVQTDTMTFDEVNEFIRQHFKRKIVVVGACTGNDAHTVGIDAIMNMKGYNGEYGLERYPEIVAYNLGSQVENDDLLQKVKEVNADAILVSQVVTQKDGHIRNLSALVDIMEAEGLRDRLVLICGGPRITHPLALELGFDAGFGAGTVPSQVATFIVRELQRRSGSTPKQANEANHGNTKEE